MSDGLHVLVAVDDSPASERALAYAGTLLGRNAGARVCLLHVAGPLPADLASEHPSDERRDAQAAWMTRARDEARPVLESARATLTDAGVEPDAVQTRTVDAPSGDFAGAILEAAKAAACGTVVVGRDSITWAPQLFHRHVGEGVTRQGRGLAVWIVG